MEISGLTISRDRQVNYGFELLTTLPNFNLLSAPNVFCVAFLYEIQFDEAFRELVETKETSVLGWGVPFQCGERDIPCVDRGQGYLVAISQLQIIPTKILLIYI